MSGLSEKKKKVNSLIPVKEENALDLWKTPLKVIDICQSRLE